MSASIEVYNPLTAYNSAISKLEKNGIRATKQRRVLAKLIFDKGKRHISAENLFDEVKKEERIFYLSPKGKKFDQKLAQDLSKEKSISLFY